MDEPGCTIEPDAEAYAWIDDPTAKCDSPDCFNWYDVSRKSCPMCGEPRNKRRNREPLPRSEGGGA